MQILPPEATGVQWAAARRERAERDNFRGISSAIAEIQCLAE